MAWRDVKAELVKASMSLDNAERHAEEGTRLFEANDAAIRSLIEANRSLVKVVNVLLEKAEIPM
jgi:hypothetical protein